MSKGQAASIAALLALLLMSAGCTAAVPAGGGAGDVRATAVPAEEHPTTDPECFGTDVSTDHVPYTIANLIGVATLATAGTVKKVGDGVWNTTDGARPEESAWSRPRFDPEVFTPIDMAVDQVLLGRLDATTVPALNEGGVADCVVTNVPSAPDLKSGERCVFFLRSGTDFDGTPRPDRLVIITAWPIDDAGMVATEEDGTISLAAVADAISKGVH
jgi:hypothetical protein